MRQVLMMGPASVEASAWGLASRMIQPSLVNLGLPARLRLRYYHADGVFRRVPRGVSGSRG
jgi:hypothetical protein